MARSKQSAATPGAHFEMLLDLGPIKLVRWTLMPGASTPRYRHPCPFIVMPRTSGTLTRIVYEDAKQTERRYKLEYGRPVLRKVGKNGLEQSVRNDSNAPVVFEKMIFCPCGEDWEKLVKKHTG
jgi:hypothetical protein